MTEHANTALTQAPTSNDFHERVTVQLRESSPFLPASVIGSREGGKPFIFTGENTGSILEKITVWVGPSMIKAVQLRLSNGVEQTFGNPNDSKPTFFVFKPKELIETLSLWGNGEGSRLGAIKFRTSLGREFFVKMTQWGLKTEYEIEVGSGICVGVTGRCGSDIDSMGFLFVKSIREAVLTDVSYPRLDLDKPQVRPVDIKPVFYKNESSVMQQISLKSGTQLTFKENWSITTALEFVYNVKVNAGIPVVAQTEVGFGFKLSVAGQYGQENSRTETEEWTYTFSIPARKTIKAIVEMGKADINLEYVATMRVTTTDGSKWLFSMNGAYDGVTYTEATVKVEEFDHV